MPSSWSATTTRRSAQPLRLSAPNCRRRTRNCGGASVPLAPTRSSRCSDLYAEQLERNYNQKKRATLETIRAELQAPYEELRRSFGALGADEIFTMFRSVCRAAGAQLQPEEARNP